METKETIAGKNIYCRVKLFIKLIKNYIMKEGLFMPKKIDRNIHFNEDESYNGCCPICQNENIHYGSLEIDINIIKYPWSCRSCDSNGKEIAHIIFGGHVVHHLPEGHVIPDLETDKKLM